MKAIAQLANKSKFRLTMAMHWFELSVARKSALPGEEPRFLVLCRDITESKQAERKIRLLAHFDSLTGLPNRVLLTDRCVPGAARRAAQWHTAGADVSGSGSFQARQRLRSDTRSAMSC